MKLYIYYEIVHKVHNKEKMKKDKEKMKTQNKNTFKTTHTSDTVKQCTTHQSINLWHCLTSIVVSLGMSIPQLSGIGFTVHPFLSHVSTAVLACDIDIGILSVRLSVCHVPELYRNGLTYNHTFFSVFSGLIVLVFSVLNNFAKFRRRHPLLERWIQMG